MSRVESQLPLRLPTSLEEQLYDFRQRVWWAKMAEAVAAAIAGVAVAYLAVFTLDRFFDTPATVRMLVAVAAIAGCMVIPYYLHRWVWRHRRLTQLAQLLSRKLPRIGDQLLGVIELADSPEEQSRSRRLCQAAIEQVADDAEKRDFRDAMPKLRTKTNTILAAATVGMGLLLWAVVPAAAENAWARFVGPWREIPRYTFAAVQPLPDEIVVAHGEEFELESRLLEIHCLEAGRSQLADWPPAATCCQARERPLQVYRAPRKSAMHR